MVEGGITNSPSCQSATQTSAFINHQNLMACLLKVIGGTEAGKAGTNN
jgi:hypothetical protein